MQNITEYYRVVRVPSLVLLTNLKSTILIVMRRFFRLFRWISSSTSLNLVGELKGVSKADIPKTLRCSGVKRAAGDAARNWEACGAEY